MVRGNIYTFSWIIECPLEFYIRWICVDHTFDLGLFLFRHTIDGFLISYTCRCICMKEIKSKSVKWIFRFLFFSFCCCSILLLFEVLFYFLRWMFHSVHFWLIEFQSHGILNNESLHMVCRFYLYHTSRIEMHFSYMYGESKLAMDLFHTQENEQFNA